MHKHGLALREQVKGPERNDPRREASPPLLQRANLSLPSPAQHGGPHHRKGALHRGPSKEGAKPGSRELFPWVLPSLHTKGTVSGLSASPDRLLFLR